MKHFFAITTPQEWLEVSYKAVCADRNGYTERINGRWRCVTPTAVYVRTF